METIHGQGRAHAYQSIGAQPGRPAQTLALQADQPAQYSGQGQFKDNLINGHANYTHCFYLSKSIGIWLALLIIPATSRATRSISTSSVSLSHLFLQFHPVFLQSPGTNGDAQGYARSDQRL